MVPLFGRIEAGSCGCSTKMVNESSAGSNDHKSLKMHVSTGFSALTALGGNGIVPPFSVRFFTLHG